MAINAKLESLTLEQRTQFKDRLTDIFEHVPLCSEYGAEDSIRMPFSDRVVVKENLYERLYSS